MANIIQLEQQEKKRTVEAEKEALAEKSRIYTILAETRQRTAGYANYTMQLQLREQQDISRVLDEKESEDQKVSALQKQIAGEKAKGGVKDLKVNQEVNSLLVNIRTLQSKYDKLKRMDRNAGEIGRGFRKAEAEARKKVRELEDLKAKIAKEDASCAAGT